MKYLVDANVLSESTKPLPDPRVVAWLCAHEPDIAVDPVILGELRFGILIVPNGRKRTSLQRWFDAGVGPLHCVPWDADTGLKWAELLARVRPTRAKKYSDWSPQRGLQLENKALHGLAFGLRPLLSAKDRLAHRAGHRSEHVNGEFRRSDFLQAVNQVGNLGDASSLVSRTRQQPDVRLVELLLLKTGSARTTLIAPRPMASTRQWHAHIQTGHPEPCSNTGHARADKHSL